VKYLDCGVWRVGRVTGPYAKIPVFNAVLMIHNDRPEPRLALWALGDADLRPHIPTQEEECTWLVCKVAS
jgi:hypothetical protein